MSNIFDQEEVEPLNESIQSYKDVLVGEGKKFKDEEALARGKYESDLFIQRLQDEQARLRQELNSRLSMEELVAKLGSSASTTTPQSSLESQPNQEPIAQPTNSTALTQEQISAIVKNTMTEESAKKSHSDNLKYCASELKKLWGDDWVNKLKSQGNAVGLTETYMDTLAKTAPKALLAIVNGQRNDRVSNDVFGAPRSTVAIAPSSQSNTNPGWAMYEKMRKEDPRRYYSPKVQLQLHNDVLSGKITVPSN